MRRVPLKDMTWIIFSIISVAIWMYVQTESIMIVLAAFVIDGLSFTVAFFVFRIILQGKR